MWAFWLSVLGGTIILFWRLWRFAEKIELQELEEQSWLTYIDSLKYSDPEQAMYWQTLFEQKFFK